MYMHTYVCIYKGNGILGGRGKLTSHDHGAVVLGLLDGVVPAPAGVVGPGLQDGELEVEVGVQG